MVKNAAKWVKFYFRAHHRSRFREHRRRKSVHKLHDQGGNGTKRFTGTNFFKSICWISRSKVLRSGNAASILAFIFSDQVAIVRTF